MRNVVVVAENEDAGKLMNYLLAYKKLMGSTEAPLGFNEASVAVNVMPALEIVVKAKRR